MPALGTNPNYPQLNRENTYTIRDTWTARVFHNHIRFGVDLWSIRFDGFQNLPYGPAGGYSFATGAVSPTVGTTAMFPDALASFLLGRPHHRRHHQFGIHAELHVLAVWGFLADRIQYRRFSIDLGLRYDYFRPVQPRDNAADYSVFNPSLDRLIALGSGVNRYGGLHANNLNFAPRVGMAFKMNDRTAIRAGYGMTYWIRFSSSPAL